MSMRFVPAPLELFFEDCAIEYELKKREYDSLSQSDDDPVSQWLKIAKARGETKNSDQVLLTLLVELHKKMDDISDLLQGNIKSYLTLSLKCQIEGIGYEYFQVKENIFEQNKKYYGRIYIPTISKKETPIFFTAIDEKISKIELIHDQDKKEWDSYVASRERIMIREMRSQKNG